MADLLDYKKSKISLSELQEFFQLEEYQELVCKIYELIDQEKIKPVKSSKTNGKVPALYQSYAIIRKKIENPKYKEELMYLSPKLNYDYYMDRHEQYEKVRDQILLLNTYLNKNSTMLDVPESLNERSFEIFAHEKFLLKEGGMTLLKHLGLSKEQLNIYDTSEPIAYFSNHKRVPQTVLFIENKDTFYTMRKYLLEGKKEILGKEIGTLVYKAGERYSNGAKDFEISVEPYLLDKRNEYLYFGDLDYKGIEIYERLHQEMISVREVIPFQEAYIKMVTKTKGRELPFTKEGQKNTLKGIFQGYFTQKDWGEMERILNSRRYIPQEALVRSDF